MSEHEIFKACEMGDERRVEKLIQADSSCVHARDKFQFTPLHAVATEAHTNIADLLVRAGAEVNAKNDKGITALHIAKEPEMVYFLVKSGADLNITDNEGNTPLILLAGEEDGYEAMEILLESGADPTQANFHGQTAHDIATTRQEFDKIQLLERHLGA